MKRLTTAMRSRTSVVTATSEKACRQRVIAAVIAVFSAAYSMPSLAVPSPAGSEFAVNTTIVLEDQYDPSVAMDAVGNFVVAWANDFENGSPGIGVYAKLFSANGSTAVSDFRVNTETSNVQWRPDVAMDADGDFVVVWESQAQDGDLGGIYAQLYDSSGNTVGGEFIVNTTTGGDQGEPAVAMDTDGDFVVVWRSPVAGSDEIFARLFNADGTPASAEIPVNTTTSMTQNGPDVAMDAGGDFVVVWSSDGQDGDSGGIYGQRFTAGGSTAGSEFRVNYVTAGSQDKAAVAMDSDGDFVVAWQGPDGLATSDIFARRFTVAGAPSPASADDTVNTTTNNSQKAAAVAMDAGGGYIISWSNEFQDTTSDGVAARRYASDGTADGNEIAVNSYTDNDQETPAIAADADGDFVIVWESRGQDSPTFKGVCGQRYGDTCDSVVPAHDPDPQPDPQPDDTSAIDDTIDDIIQVASSGSGALGWLNLFVLSAFLLRRITGRQSR